jgi:hypothetical protein
MTPSTAKTLFGSNKQCHAARSTSISGLSP